MKRRVYGYKKLYKSGRYQESFDAQAKSDKPLTITGTAIVEAVEPVEEVIEVKADTEKLKTVQQDPVAVKTDEDQDDGVLKTDDALPVHEPEQTEEDPELKEIPKHLTGFMPATVQVSETTPEEVAEDTE